MSEINIRNCNSIDVAEFSLVPGALNMKYGPNGIGKSTIARALSLNSGGDSLTTLIPFKYRAGSGHPQPSVDGADHLQSILVFDDSYVSSFAFQPDEVLKDSFEIFINTDEYKDGISRIAAIFDQLKTVLNSNDEFSQALSSFVALRDAFNVTKTGALAKTSRGMRALKVGGKLTKIPQPLQGYRDFIWGDDPAGWMAWQKKGHGFIENCGTCPFCASPDIDAGNIRRVAEEYDTAAVKNMSVLRETVSRLNVYFSDADGATLTEILSILADPTSDQVRFLIALRAQIETFLAKMESIQELSFHSFSDVDDVDRILRELRIDLRLLRSLDSDATRSVVRVINDELDSVESQIGNIKGHVGRQRSRIASLIESNQDAINRFLESAGYKYVVKIEAADDCYRMILQHRDATGHIESAASHLSYGERNAFALVLFMHQARHDRPDLVILDDPVSSFDRTKKFAILHELFQGQGGIRDFTTLLLTHDLEPAIDVVRSVASAFQGANAVVHFLSGKGGTVTEKRITSADISTFSDVCKTNIVQSTEHVLKCIYLRRLFEARGERGLEYDLLSSLLHLRIRPTKFSSKLGQHEKLNAAEVVSATKGVRVYIPDFDYARTVSELSDPEALRAKFHSTSVGYEKVQIYRIYLESTGAKSKSTTAIMKFVNETYHIENEYVMQLNPREFDSVPNYIVAACEELIES